MGAETLERQHAIVEGGRVAVRRALAVGSEAQMLGAFAIVPLVMFTRDRAKMGALVAPGWLTVIAGIIAAIIIALNMKLLWDLATG